MMNPFNLEAGVKGQILTPGKDSEALTSYKLFSYPEPLGAIVRDI